MLNIPKFELIPYLDVAWRRKWWILLPLILILIAGVLYLQLSPKVYKASTLILVDAQRVPNEFVPSQVTEDLEKRLLTISQQVRSRTNLEDIIERFDMDPASEQQEPSLVAKLIKKFLFNIGLMEASAHKQEKEQTSMQDLVKNVRDRITVDVRALNQAFEISFEWQDPHVVAQVTNALASQFIDRNLKVRTEIAMGTTRFLDTEVLRMQEQLQKREQALEGFKRRSMGRLPSQLDSNLNMLSQLKEELGRIEDREEEVRRQLMLARQESAIFEASDDEHFLQHDQYAQEIKELQERLQEMRTKYKEQHPDIQVLQRRLEQLQEKYAELSLEDFQPLPESKQSSPEQNMIQVQQQEMQMRLDNFEEQKKKLRQEISKYEQRIEDTSEVELQLKNLERDYQAVNDRYQDMLRKKLDAEMGEQMERRQQGEQFRVVDPAITPEKPFRPDRNKVMAMALVLGLGFGGGLGYFRESLDPAFYTPQELEQDLGAKVVVCLPYVQS